MGKIGTTIKELFTILGEFKLVDGQKRFVPRSPSYFRQCQATAPLGKMVSVTFSAKIPSRSQAQLAYHWVLMGLISENTGYSTQEASDLVLAEFGAKEVVIGKRRVLSIPSISDRAKFPLAKMVEVIMMDLDLCKELGIKVPTMEELGYISNDKRYY